MQIDPLAQVGDILRALVRNARDVIFVDEQNRSVMAVAHRQFLHINDCAIGNAPHALKPGAPFALQLGRTLRLAPQQRVSASHNRAAADNDQRIET